MTQHEYINDRTLVQNDTHILEGYENDVAHIDPVVDTLRNIDMLTGEMTSIEQEDIYSEIFPESLARELHATILIIQGDLQRVTSHMLANNPSELSATLADISTYISLKATKQLHEYFGECTQCNEDLTIDAELIHRHVTALVDDTTQSSFPEQLTAQLEGQLSSVARHFFEHLLRE